MKTMQEHKFEGDRLRLARLFYCLSQHELGERVETSRQYVHQLENETKAPSQDLVGALAVALNVNSSFFYKPVSNWVTDEQCHFRKLRTTLVSHKRQALAQGTLFDEVLNVIEKHLSLPVVNFPSIDVLSSEDIERAAERCRIEWGLGVNGPITNMCRVVENSGAVVVNFESVSEKVDALSFSRRRPIIVRSSLKQSICRLRFDIAHECGHLIMHQGMETGDRETEQQANRFASAFLLPRSAFIHEFPKGNRLLWSEIYSLKIRWKVSVSAIIRRAFDLGLIDALLYRRANIYLSKTGQTKNERYEDKISAESPELLSNALSALKVRHGIDFFDLARRMRCDSSFLLKLLGMNEIPENLYPDDLGDNVVRLRAL